MSKEEAAGGCVQGVGPTTEKGEESEKVCDSSARGEDEKGWYGRRKRQSGGEVVRDDDGDGKRWWVAVKSR